MRKVIFPVAGLGTRFLPVTKANPKEMLPIVDKPLIQYAVEEAISAGFTELIFVTSNTKRAIEDHFDSNYELESKLEKQNKQALLNIVRDVLPKGIHCVYIRQPESLGLGHAILCAESLINDEPFAVVLADDLIHAKPGCLSQMRQAYRERQHSIIAVQEIASKDTSQYGIVAIDQQYHITQIVEKPAPAEAPSNLGVVGRYLLTPAIFFFLQQILPDIRGEIQLTDGIARLLSQENVSAFKFNGKRYDCGSKQGYVEATVAYALNHPEIGADFSVYLKKLLAVSL